MAPKKVFKNAEGGNFIDTAKSVAGVVGDLAPHFLPLLLGLGQKMKDIDEKLTILSNTPQRKVMKDDNQFTSMGQFNQEQFDNNVTNSLLHEKSGGADREIGGAVDREIGGIQKIAGSKRRGGIQKIAGSKKGGIQKIAGSDGQSIFKDLMN